MTQRLNDLYSDKPVMMMVYGEAGTGKTTWLKGAGDRQLILDLGKGLRSILGTINPLVINTEFSFLDLKDTKGFDRVRDQLFKTMEEEIDNYDTVSIDELTTLGMLAKIKAIQVNQDLGKSSSLVNSRKEKIIVMELSDWGAAIDAVNLFLAELSEVCYQTGKNLLVLAHQRDVFKKAAKQGETPDLEEIRVGIYGRSFPDTIPNHFDYCWHFSIDGKGRNRRYKIQTEGDEIIMAKTRGANYDAKLDRTEGGEKVVSFADVISYNKELSNVHTHA